MATTVNMADMVEQKYRPTRSLRGRCSYAECGVDCRRGTLPPTGEGASLRGEKRELMCSVKKYAILDNCAEKNFQYGICLMAGAGHDPRRHKPAAGAGTTFAIPTEDEMGGRTPSDNLIG